MPERYTPNYEMIMAHVFTFWITRWFLTALYRILLAYLELVFLDGH